LDFYLTMEELVLLIKKNESSCQSELFFFRQCLVFFKTKFLNINSIGFGPSCFK
jgi:hypothetical protein